MYYSILFGLKQREDYDLSVGSTRSHSQNSESLTWTFEDINVRLCTNERITEYTLT